MSTGALVIIDPQNDFCDPQGSLYVEGAEADIVRLSEYVRTMGASASGLFVSLDSHDDLAIFHPAFWTNAAGEHPSPFTPLTHGDFRSGKWKPASPVNAPLVERTFGVMETRGETSLMIWPEHCVVSTRGHAIAAPLLAAFRDWRAQTGLAVRYVFKGENPYTDQFSVFEGLDNTWPETAFDENLFAQLSRFDRLTFAGEALSHCVQDSILSYMRRLGGAKQTVRLLTDCTSPVRGFDRQTPLDRLSAAGVTFVTTASPDCAP